MKKSTRLRNIIQNPDLSFLMEAHNALSAKIAQESGFEALWASGLSISASLGLCDRNEASSTQVLNVVEFMADHTHVPILLDGDTGFGNFNNVRRLVKKLSQLGVAGVCTEQYHQQGYAYLPQGLTAECLQCLEHEYADLSARATRLLLAANSGELDLAAYYRTCTGEPFVVPEAANPCQICRMEYLAACSEYIRTQLIAYLTDLIGATIEQVVVVFKDKCNVKHPNGGGFPPHQDIAAYRHFAVSYHVTAALMLDAATIANGCLELAPDYCDISPGSPTVEAPLGSLPILPYYKGGARHGAIVSELAEQLVWKPVEAAAGDIILFDSFIPHCSASNRSTGSRRVMFFTFNLASDGDLYETYYRAKRRTPDHPMFHVSTPTLHGLWNETARAC